MTNFFEQIDINPPVANFIGETCKAIFENNTIMFMEVIETIPLTVYVFICPPHKKFTVSGYHKLKMSTNLLVDELYIKNLSKYKIVFNESKEEYTFTLPNLY